MDEAPRPMIDRWHPFMQLLIIIWLAFGCAFIILIISMKLIQPIYHVNGADELMLRAQTDPDAVLANANQVNALKFIQLMSEIGSFGIPALIFAYSKRTRDFLRVRSKNYFYLLILGMAIVCLSGPFISYIYELNMQMKLPEALSSLQQWIKNTQDASDKVTEVFLQMNSWRDLLVNLFVIALIPAVCEELLFRGCLQQIFREWFKNPHTAIWITAVIFSAAHLEFYGFVPRMILGAVLGYLFYWSNSLWAPIFGHMIYNGGQLVLAFLFQLKLISFNINSDAPTPRSAVIAGTGITILCLIAFYNYCKKRNLFIPQSP
jgi:uncharacterized protein